MIFEWELRWHWSFDINGTDCKNERLHDRHRGIDLVIPTERERPVVNLCAIFWFRLSSVPKILHSLAIVISSYYLMPKIPRRFWLNWILTICYFLQGNKGGIRRSRRQQLSSSSTSEDVSLKRSSVARRLRSRQSSQVCKWLHQVVSH